MRSPLWPMPTYQRHISTSVRISGTSKRRHMHKHRTSMAPARRAHKRHKHHDTSTQAAQRHEHTSGTVVQAHKRHTHIRRRGAQHKQKHTGRTDKYTVHPALGPPTTPSARCHTKQCGYSQWGWDGQDRRDGTDRTEHTQIHKRKRMSTIT